MREDVSLEHLLERVTLVKGSGDRGNGQLCVMSLAALIAGERHTDTPNSVSPFIRRFAIAINDHLPAQERQRLKLFAPRMVGTNDKHDQDRARLLVSILTSEIAPALRSEGARHWLAAPCDMRDPIDFVTTTLDQACDAVARKRIGAVADCASHLLTTCARSAPTGAIRSHCWSWAVDILDRLCSVGDEDRATLTSDLVAAAHRTLDGGGVFKRVDLWMKNFSTSVARRFRAVGGLVRAFTETPSQLPGLPQEMTSPAHASARSTRLKSGAGTKA